MPAIINSPKRAVSDYRCFFCFAKAFEKLLEAEKIPVEAKNYFTREMAGLYMQQASYFSAPAFSRELHHILQKYSLNDDHYKLEKKKSNDQVLALYDDFKKQVLETDDPFQMALRLAVAGNIIDFAVGNSFDLQETIEKVLHSRFAVDHSVELRQAVQKANTVLYLGDNAGEIVFDKLFIETLMHPNLFYAVRGAPVINDATLEDASYVGMDSVADVLSNGYDAPSTLLDHCSPEFKALFQQADVIISKGQGNLEGLFDQTGKNIFFLLMVKCDVIAEALQVRKGDFVVLKKNL
jgi:hypothetical protein